MSIRYFLFYYIRDFIWDSIANAKSWKSPGFAKLWNNMQISRSVFKPFKERPSMKGRVVVQSQRLHFSIELPSVVGSCKQEIAVFFNEILTPLLGISYDLDMNNNNSTNQTYYDVNKRLSPLLANAYLTNSCGPINTSVNNYHQPNTDR